MSSHRFQPAILVMVLLCVAAQVAGYGRGLRLCIGCDSGEAPYRVLAEGDDASDCCPGCGDEQAPTREGDPPADPCGCVELTLLESGVVGAAAAGAGDYAVLAWVELPRWAATPEVGAAGAWMDRPPPLRATPVSARTILVL